jgi:hypothetical protein
LIYRCTAGQLVTAGIGYRRKPDDPKAFVPLDETVVKISVDQSRWNILKIGIEYEDPRMIQSVEPQELEAAT